MCLFPSLRQNQRAQGQALLAQVPPASCGARGKDMLPTTGSWPPGAERREAERGCPPPGGPGQTSLPDWSLSRCLWELPFIFINVLRGLLPAGPLRWTDLGPGLWCPLASASSEEEQPREKCGAQPVSPTHSGAACRDGVAGSVCPSAQAFSTNRGEVCFPFLTKLQGACPSPSFLLVLDS